MDNKTINGLIEFIDKTPTCFHAVENFSGMLDKSGFTRLFESRKWDIKPGGKYYVCRNGSTIAAFVISKKPFKSFMIAAAHSDSPSFKIKPEPEITVDNKYVKLSVEKYGGMIISSWLDRPLSIAGRAAFRTPDGVAVKNVNIDRDLVCIPNLAIHMDGGMNEGVKWNVRTHMPPLFGDYNSKGKFEELIASTAEIAQDKLLGYDLFLYNRDRGKIWGVSDEYFSCPRIDDLQCAYSAITGLINTADIETEAVRAAVIFDNEEVGSGTKQGARSTFLRDTLTRINEELGGGRSDYISALASGFMLSADNAHAVHPNNPDKADPNNRPYMNDGVVIKYNANQRYVTDSVSEAIFKEICERRGIKYQIYSNRSDIPGGSTLGNLSNEQVALNSVDIGLAQLAMHSAYETAGSRDLDYMISAVETFYSTELKREFDDKYTIVSK